VARHVVYLNTVRTDGEGLDAELTIVTYGRMPFRAGDVRIEIYAIGQPTAGDVLDALARAADIEVTRDE
jgi:hypothetical protein